VTAGAPGRVWRTVRHLQARQVAGQLRLRLVGHRRRRLPCPPPGLALERPAVPFLPAPAFAWSDGGRRFRLRNRSVGFRERVDWSHADDGPLFAYDLHSFEWLRHPALAPKARATRMLDWIEHHPRGIGWDGHPLSLRTVAWQKCLLTPGAVELEPGARTRVLASLAEQLETLAANLETGLLANHYLSNLLALVFAGLAQEGPAADRWLGHGALLADELAEQVPPDGLHYERSPMYHAVLLEAVLDCVNLVRARPGRAPDSLASALGDAAARMRGALQVMTHPDGGIALFGDSAFGVAHEPEALARQADALGVAARAPARPGVLADTGFVRLEAGPFVLIASVAGPMPAYQPGHAHCDALAFELSVDGTRVVTDTGVSEYIPGRLRDLARATRSHATLEVAGHDQAELWAAHRVGGRPEVQLTALEPGRALEAWCAGWATRQTRHVRRLALAPDGVLVEDRLEGAPRRARLALPLAPGLAVRRLDDAVEVTLPGGASLGIRLEGGPRLGIDHGPCFPEFGRSEERPVLVAEADPWPATRLRIGRG